ncbi:hypothetical protein IKF12_02245 [Candidatus Saccharibacteria bacterium]|nr:hypothetical protein [Candidatus Saccharibacteria bacterium]
MKRSRVYLSSIISIIFGGLGIVSTTFALEYQSNPVNIKFEFGSTLTFSSPGDIIISNLVPGTKAISDEDYKVTVSTNNLTGYTLYATVGCASGTNCNDSKNLTDGTNNFTMVSSTGALTAGMWGVSLDDNATENSNFMTLAKYDDLAATIINQTTNNTGTPATGYAGTSDTTVRIGAYATASQVAGTYVNKINFIPIANMMPNCGNYIADYCMQDQTQSSLASIMPNVGDEVTMTDSRDGKTYTVAHLADGNYWMTQNLDHNIVTTAGYYTPQNTDIPSAWTPSTATYSTGDTTTWNGGSIAPESYDPGDVCWDGTIKEDEYGTLDNETTACGSDKHMHIGNYYNWTAAVAMNDSSSYTADNTDADQSICPAGWMLPKCGTAQTGSGSFIYLWNQYSSTFNEETMMNSPLYFSYAGGRDGSSYGVGSGGFYWSSVVELSYYAYGLAFGLDYELGGGRVSPQDGDERSGGHSVRCVAR